MFKKINKENKVTRGEGSQYTIDNYLTKDMQSNISVAVSHLNGKIGTTKNIASDRVYYFIKANANFYIDNQEVHVKDSDVLFIEKGTSYSMEGFFDAVLINTPAFDIKDEQSII